MSSTVRNENQRNIGYIPSNLRSGDSELDLVTKQLNHKAYNTVDKPEEIGGNGVALDSMIIERRDNTNTAKNKKRISDMLEVKSDKPLDGVPVISTSAEVDKTAESVENEVPPDGSRKRKMSSNYIAQVLMEDEDFVVYCGELYHYVESYGYWRLIRDIDDYPILMKIIPLYLRDYIHSSSMRQIYGWLKTDAREITQKDIIDRKDYVNFKNCALCLNNNQIISDRKNLYFMNYIPHEFTNKKIDKEGSLYNRVIKNIFKDKETRERFEEMLGLIISQVRDKKLTFFFYGPTNSGKSVFMNVCKGLIGSEFTTSLSFSQLNKEFAVANLQGKWLNVSGEISDLNKQKVDVFKSLTGNDMILTNYKFRSFFDMVNTALLLFSCNNECPVSSGEIEALSSRIIVFPFKNEVPREDWIEDLSEKLLSEKDIIIHRAIKGLMRLRERNYMFDETIEMLECKLEFLGGGNNFLLFAKEHIIKDPDYEVLSSDITKYYEAYCKKIGKFPNCSNVWSKLLKNKYKAKSIHVTKAQFLEDPDNYNDRGYRGIRLINTEILEGYVSVTSK